MHGYYYRLSFGSDGSTLENVDDVWDRCEAQRWYRHKGWCLGTPKRGSRGVLIMENGSSVRSLLCVSLWNGYVWMSGVSRILGSWYPCIVWASSGLHWVCPLGQYGEVHGGVFASWRDNPYRLCVCTIFIDGMWYRTFACPIWGQYGLVCGQEMTLCSTPGGCSDFFWLVGTRTCVSWQRIGQVLQWYGFQDLCQRCRSRRTRCLQSLKLTEKGINTRPVPVRFLVDAPIYVVYHAKERCQSDAIPYYAAF